MRSAMVLPEVICVTPSSEYRVPEMVTDGKSQQLLFPESTLLPSLTSMFASPEQALESLTSTLRTVRVPDTSSPHAVPEVEDRSVTRVSAACPFMFMLTNVEVAFSKNLSFVFAVIAVSVEEAETAAENMMEGSVCASVPELLVISRLLNAEVDVMVPESVCADVPSKKVVPPLWVKVPEFE